MFRKQQDIHRRLTRMKKQNNEKNPMKTDSAEVLMKTDFLTIPDHYTVDDAITYFRRSVKNKNNIHYIYVVNHSTLVGVISVKELFIADGKKEIQNIMMEEVISVPLNLDQDIVARTFKETDLLSIPVVNHQQRMVGIIHVDDILDVMEKEATKDFQRLGGSEPLNHSYFESSILSIFVKRIPWLLLLFVAEAYTGTVLKYFEDEIEKVVALSFFIPLLVGTGGNIGTQVVATIIRAVGIGEVKFKDMFRVIKKEVVIGLLLGLVLGIAGLSRAYILGVGTEVAQVVALTMVFIVVWASIVASALPLILRKMKLDPAVVSGPFITTFVDGTGLVIYFMIAKMLIL